MTRRYAEGTEVLVEKSKVDIEVLLRRHGSHQAQHDTVVIDPGADTWWNKLRRRWWDLADEVYHRPVAGLPLRVRYRVGEWYGDKREAASRRLYSWATDRGIW